MLNIDIRHLRLIDAIAKTQNLTKAASLVNISQPAASQQLKEVEDRLETLLFYRAKKKMILTKVGEIVLASAGKIIDELKLLEYEISKVIYGEVGDLKIGMHCVLSYQWITDVMNRFKEIYPRVDISVGNSTNVLKDLESRKRNIVITATPLTHSAIHLSRLFEDEIVAVMELNHPLTVKQHLEAEDFEGAHYISIMKKKEDLLVNSALKPMGIRLGGFSTVEQPEAVLELVKSGFGVSVFPMWAVNEQIVAGELAARKLTRSCVKLAWYAASLSSQQPPGYQNEFLKLSKDVLFSKFE